MDLCPRRAADDSYATLAPLYDEFVAHPAYRQWVLSIEATARNVGVGGVRLLDVGCGTGRSYAPLLGRGYLVTGCDPVATMLAQARRRSPRRVRLDCGLVSDAPLGPFDLILALNDVVNCIPDQAQLRDTLRAIAARLAPRGIFAFDVTAPGAHARLFERRSERTTARARFEWRPLASNDAGVHRAVLRMRPARRPQVATVHRQRVVTASELAGVLAEAGLRVAAERSCDNSGHLGPAAGDAFKHVLFTQLSHERRRGKEVPDAQGAQAAQQGRGHAGDRQGRVTDRVGAAVAAAPADQGWETRDG